MTLMKYVLDENKVEHYVEMTPDEEAQFLASQADASKPPPVPPEPTKAELMAQIQALMAKVEAIA